MGIMKYFQQQQLMRSSMTMGKHVELNKIPILINKRNVQKQFPFLAKKKEDKIARSKKKEQERFKANQDSNALQKVSASNILLVTQAKNKRQENISI